MNYKINVMQSFIDMKSQQRLSAGDTLETNDKKRVINIVKSGLGVIMESEAEKQPPRMVYLSNLAKCGGIETAVLNLARQFGEKIRFVFGKADGAMFSEICRLSPAKIDNNIDRYDVDVLVVMGYASPRDILNRVKARKVYHQIHADFKSLVEVNPSFKSYPLKDGRVDRYLTVSQTAQDGLEAVFGLESAVVPNIFGYKPRIVFACVMRTTAEKGFDRVIKFCDWLASRGLDFVLFLATDEVYGYRGADLGREYIVKVPCGLKSQEIMRAADYLLQFSYSESYCYSVREALARGVACIVSDIPELKKVINSPKRGYVISADTDFNDELYDQIVNHIPRPEPYHEKLPLDLWEKVWGGQL